MLPSVRFTSDRTAEPDARWKDQMELPGMQQDIRGERMTFPEPIRVIRASILAKPTYPEFKEAFTDYYGRLPIGLEILQFWQANAVEYRRMCPNPCRTEKVKA